MKFSFVLLSFLIFCVISIHGRPMEAQNKINAIYSFGDSLADTGNLMHQNAEDATLKLVATDMSKYPYGLNTFNISTGRCSDGLLIIDYLANEFGLPLLNPYLVKEANFAHGVNFAVAGATAQDVNFFEHLGTQLPLTNSSLSVQFSWFKTHLNSLCSSTEECAKLLKNSFIVLGEIGGDDYNYQLTSRISVQNITSNIPQVINKIKSVAQELIDMGVTNIMIPGNLPMGCLPSYLTIFNAKKEQCLEQFNDLAKAHNKQLLQAIANLRMKNPDVNIIYADFYATFMHMLNNSRTLGFEKPFKSCCGQGGMFNFNMTTGCGSSGATICEDTTKYINWDGIHLTQQGYLTFTRILLGDNGYTTPSFNSLYKWRF